MGQIKNIKLHIVTDIKFQQRLGVMESLLFCEISRINTTTTVNTTTEEREEITVLYGINFLVIGIAFIMNKIGIVLLIRAKDYGISNLNLLFVHLSFIGIIYLGLTAVALKWKSSDSFFEEWYFVVFDSIYMAYLISLLFLSLERLLYVYLRIRYSIVLTKLVIIVLIFLTWLLAVSYAMILKVYYNKNITSRKTATFVSVGCVVTFSLFSFIVMETNVNKTTWVSSQHVTSSSFFYKPYIRRRRQYSTSVTSELRQKYTTTFFVVVTYIFTAVVPLLIAAYFYGNCTYEMDEFLLTLVLLHDLNFVVVPLLYVLLQKKVRSFSSSIIHKTKSLVRNSTIFEDSEEKERLMVREIYEGTNNLYGSVEVTNC